LSAVDTAELLESVLVLLDAVVELLEAVADSVAAVVVPVVETVEPAAIVLARLPAAPAWCAAACKCARA